MAPSAQRKKTSRSLRGRSQSPVSQLNSVSRQRTSLIPLACPSLASPRLAQRRRLTGAADNTLADRPLHASPAPSQYGFLPAADDEDFRNDELDHVVVAIDSMDRGKVGCAYYVAREESMFCMKDVAHGGLEIVETRKFLPRSNLLMHYAEYKK
jgi:DNA mismatch repair protein MSH5